MKPTLVVVFCLALGGNLAFAQTHQEQGVFVHGGAFASHELRSHNDIDTDGVLALVAPSDSSSTVAGGTAGIGVFLRPFLSVRADVLFEGESDQQFPYAILTDLLGDLPGLGRPGDLPISLPATQSARTRTNSVQALLAYHLESSARFRLALLGGVSFERRRTRFSTRSGVSVDFPPLPGVVVTRPDIPIRQIDYSFVSYQRDLVVGVDGELAMGDHFVLVPQFRVVGGSGSVRMQPGVSARWRP